MSAVQVKRYTFLIFPGNNLYKFNFFLKINSLNNYKTAWNGCS